MNTVTYWSDKAKAWIESGYEDLAFFAARMSARCAIERKEPPPTPFDPCVCGHAKGDHATHGRGRAFCNAGCCAHGGCKCNWYRRSRRKSDVEYMKQQQEAR